MMMLGEIGLILLVVEAGLEVDLKVLRQIGMRGLVIGIVGSFLPLAIGFGLASCLGFGTNAALSIGAVFSPTSMGVACVVLKKGNVLNTPVGQLIVASAVIDDIVALVILSMLQALGKGEEAKLMDFLAPIIAAIGFTLVIGGVAIKVMPGYLQKSYVTSRLRVPKQHYEGFMLGVLLAFVLALMPALHYGKGSYLLGCFLAGLCFCTVHEMEEVWKSQVKRLMRWLLRVFFAATGMCACVCVVLCVCVYQ